MDFVETQSSNDFPQVTFKKDKAVAFCLFDKKDAIYVGGINLFDKARDEVLRSLARLENTYYENGEDFFFPRSGVCIPTKKASRTLPYIILIQPQYQLNQLDFSLYEPSTRLS